MAKNIQVVLRSDVDNLGISGDLVNVKPGYARNYLVPRGLAVVATRGNIRQVEHERKLALLRLEKEKADAEAKAAKFANLSVTIQKEAGEEGKLFGSVTSADIAAALNEQDIDVDKKKIELPDGNLKQVGEHEVSIKLGAGVSAVAKVIVEANES